MSPDKADNERNSLRMQLRFHKALNVIFGVTIFFGVLLVGYIVLRDTTRIVPPEIRRPYVIGSGTANKDYLLDMTDYVISKILTVTPEIVDYNNDVILKITHPDGYPALKTALDAAAKRIKEERITTVWVPRIEDVSEDELRVKVSGKLKTYIADKLTSERDKDYIVEFTVTSSGRLYVSKVEEIVKHDSAVSDGA